MFHKRAAGFLAAGFFAALRAGFLPAAFFFAPPFLAVLPAAFFVVFIASIMYLLQERELKLKTFSAIFHRLPSLATICRKASSIPSRCG